MTITRFAPSPTSYIHVGNLRTALIGGPTRTNLKIRIFVADKGKYYDIVDGLPQNDH